MSRHDAARSTSRAHRPGLHRAEENTVSMTNADAATGERDITSQGTTSFADLEIGRAHV